MHKIEHISSMDLNALVEQTQGKMLNLREGMDTYAQAVEEYQSATNTTLDILNESIGSAKESIEQNQVLVTEVLQNIENLGENTNTRVNELEEQVSEFTSRIESIEDEINSRLIECTDLMISSISSCNESFEGATTVASDYVERVKELENNFSNTISTIDQHKETISSVVQSTIDTTTTQFEESLSNLSELRELYSSKTEALLNQFNLMVESTNSLTQDLLNDTKSMQEEKFATIEGLIGTTAISNLADASSSWKEASEGLNDLGLDDIAQFSSKIDEVLEFTDKVQDVYDTIKPVIDLIS